MLQISANIAEKGGAQVVFSRTEIIETAKSIAVGSESKTMLQPQTLSATVTLPTVKHQSFCRAEALHSIAAEILSHEEN